MATLLKFIVFLSLKMNIHQAYPINAEDFLIDFHKGSAKLTREAIIMFHGFPAYKEKNTDLAKNISKKTSTDVYLLKYKGINGPIGNFSFTNSIKEAIRFKEYITSKEYENIYLIGHSWGGYVAANVLLKSSKKIKSVILLNPLLQIPNDENIKKTIQHFLEREREIGRNQKNLDELISDIKRAKNIYSIKQLKTKNLKYLSKISLIHGLKDSVIPLNSIEKFFSTDKKSLKSFKVLDQDHWFHQSKDELLKSIINIVDFRKD